MIPLGKTIVVGFEDGDPCFIWGWYLIGLVRSCQLKRASNCLSFRRLLTYVIKDDSGSKIIKKIPSFLYILVYL